MNTSQSNTNSSNIWAKLSLTLSVCAVILTTLSGLYYPVTDLFRTSEIFIHPGAKVEIELEADGFPAIYVYLRTVNLGNRTEAIGQIDLNLQSKNDDSYNRTFNCDAIADAVWRGENNNLTYIPYTGITMPVDYESKNWYKLKEKINRNSILEQGELYNRIGTYCAERKREQNDNDKLAYALPNDLLDACKAMFRKNIIGFGEGDYKGSIVVYGTDNREIANIPFETTIFRRDFEPIERVIVDDLAYGYNLYWDNPNIRTAHIKMWFNLTK